MSRSIGMAKNSLFAAGQVLWTTIVLFVVYRLVTHKTGVSLLGVWSGAVAISALAALADCGLTDLMVRQIAEARGQENWIRVVSLYRSLSVFAAIMVALAVILLAPIVFITLSSAAGADIKPVLWWMIAGASFTVWLNTVNVGLFGVLEALGRYDLKFWAAVASGLGTLVIAILVLPNAATVGVALTFAVGATINTAFALIANQLLLAAKRNHDVANHADRISWRELVSMLKMGSQVRLAGIFLLGLEPVTRVFLVRFGGLEAVGIYELAYRAIFQLRSLIVSALQVLVPGLAAIRVQNPRQAIDMLSQATYHAITLGLPAFVVAILLVPALSFLMLGKLEWNLGVYALLLALAWMINMAAAPSYFANLAEGKVKNNWLAHLAICIANVSLGFVLGMTFGAGGVVIGTAIAIAFGSIVTLASRRGEALCADFVLTTTDWIMLGVGACSLVALYVVWDYFKSTTVVMPLALLCLMTYGAAVFVRAVVGFLRKSRLQRLAII